MTEKRFIRCKATQMWVNGVLSDFEGNLKGAVSLTPNKAQAMEFDDTDYVFDFIQTSEDSGTLVEAFSNPLIGGFNSYEVVNDIGAIIPPNR